MAKELRSDDVFLDIGANVGMYSIWASKFISKKGNVIAIEPNPLTFQRLSYSIALNDKNGVIVPLNIGVADNETSFDLYVDPTNSGGATIMVKPAHFNKVEIQCQELTAILERQGINKIDVMKIDIGGRGNCFEQIF
ncbi:MAG: FkbM family methyltransferase [Bacteroidota bacterium]|nr:FkbM family methyltransferase [Bacteroidota bacterium]